MIYSCRSRLSWFLAILPIKCQGGKGMKILIVYFSWSGNTQRIAEIIHKLVGGEMLRLESQKPYPSTYKETVQQAKTEIRENYKPPLKTKMENIRDYDLIFVGSPNWWGTIAPPVVSFLTQYDLSGKTIVPFFSHGGGGKQRMAETIRALCPNSKVLEEFATYESGEPGLEKNISKWLTSIGLHVK